MKILILGGTRFLGRHFVQQALDAGHDVTLLHRGRSGPDLFPHAEHLIADRDADLSVLEGGTWDVAFDPGAYFPRQVEAVADVLAGRIGQYQLVSTISVYDGFDAAGTDEEAPLQVLADAAVDTVTGASYGGLKVLCEQVAQDRFAGRCLVSRPGLLVGPHDPTGRFTWWLQRLAGAAADDEVLAPGDPGAAVQFIDCRDVAAWHLLQAESGATGVFNVTGPTEPTTMGEVLETARRLLAPSARLVWVDEASVLAHGVKPWTELPLWLPQADAGLHRVDIERARTSGLVCRPLSRTVADTWAWAADAPTLPTGGPLRPPIGLSAERERALLASV